MASTTTVTCNAIVPELLNPHNYKHWSSRVRTYLVAKDLWDVVKGKHPTSDGKVWIKKNAEALHVINISCGTEMFSHISEINKAMDAWAHLEKVFKLRPRSEIEEKDFAKMAAPTTTPASSQLYVNANSGENNANNFDRYRPFFESVKNGDWVKAKRCLSGPDADNALRATNPHTRCTALHVAALEGHVHIVKELVQLMGPEDLEIKDIRGATPLGTLVRNCKVEEDAIKMAKYMVQRNNRLVCIPVPMYNYLPVVEASGWNNWKLSRYLYSVTPPEALMPANGRHGVALVRICFSRLQMLDIAQDLLKDCPILAIDDQDPPLLVLAGTHSAFLSGTQLTCWERWIYNRIHIQTDLNIHGISISVSNLEEDQDNTNRICSVMSLFRKIRKGLLKRLGINTIYETKVKHLKIIEILERMREDIRNPDRTPNALDVVGQSMFRATEKGHVEFVTHICKANYELLTNIYDETKKSIFHFAVECRQEKIYCLINGLEKYQRKELTSAETSSNNNMLFKASNLSPLSRLDQIQGASLQMQRELQWFKEMEKMVPSEIREALHTVESLTPRELFTKNHKKLMKEAELSMKGTATSCTTVGALIVTIMFAVVFTLPGGSKGDTGIPVFINKSLFMILIVSDIISLISSTTSVIIFLGILTSRYAEDDFLISLPTKMMIGLFTLFLAIAAMMVTFSCALIIMLHGKYSWIVLLSILVSSVPVSSFAWMQFPLLIETFMSTYGPGIFDRKVKPWLQS